MAYAFVGSGVNSANGNTVTYSPTAGNALVILIGTSPGGGSPTVSVSDNKGSSYQVAKAQTANPSFWSGVEYLLNCQSGITTITCTFNGGTPGQCNILVLEYSGLSSFIGCTSANAQSAAGTGANAVVSSALNVTSQPAAFIGLCYDSNQNHPASAGTGFTARYGLATGDGLFAEDERITSTGNQTATLTLNTGTDATQTYAIAFAEPATVNQLISWSQQGAMGVMVAQ